MNLIEYYSYKNYHFINLALNAWLFPLNQLMTLKAVSRNVAEFGWGPRQNHLPSRQVREATKKVIFFSGPATKMGGG